MKLTIIGGGGLGHVSSAVASSTKENQVDLLTGHPDKWHHVVTATDPNGKQYVGTINTISSNPSDVIPSADIVLLCLPGYLIEETLLKIKPYLNSHTTIGSIVSSTGFFFQAHRVLPEDTPLFGFQRVPYISRVDNYGSSAFLLGYKKELAIAVEHYPDSESLRRFIEKTFLTPTILLKSFFEAALSNSNPILHTARLYTLWHNWDGSPYDHQIFFYKEWDIPSAQKLIDMDKEFFSLLKVLPVRDGVILPLLEYYESSDAQSLAQKISSIPAFLSITAPMVQQLQGWIPDFSSRYFTEDFPFGLKYIKDLASEHNIPTPHIDQVLDWGLAKTR